MPHLADTLSLGGGAMATSRILTGRGIVLLALSAALIGCTQPLGLLPGGQGVDRKSTRLNSSHQIISYAVFCLKKKKTKKFNAYFPTQLSRITRIAARSLSY